MDDEFFEALRQGKRENYEMIYNNEDLNALYDGQIAPMFAELYEELLRQAKSMDKNSILYEHHISYVKKNNYRAAEAFGAYEDEEPNQIVVDFLASVTDDYFIALYKKLFPRGKYGVDMKGYF